MPIDLLRLAVAGIRHLEPIAQTGGLHPQHELRAQQAFVHGARRALRLREIEDPCDARAGIAGGAQRALEQRLNIEPISKPDVAAIQKAA